MPTDDDSTPHTSETDEAQSSGDVPRQTDGHPQPDTPVDYDAFERDDRAPTQDCNTPTATGRLSVARTLISLHEDDYEDGHWERLRALNNGRGEQDRALQLQAAGMHRDLDIAATRLGASDHQKARTRWLLDRIDLKDDLIPSGPIELAIIGVLTVVMDEDRMRYADSDVTVQSVLRDNAYDSLIESYDLPRNRVHQVRARLRETDTYQQTSPPSSTR